MSRYLTLLVAPLVMLLAFPAWSFTPHADCTFQKIDPLPKMDDCAHLERRVRKIKNNMAAAQRAMDKLREAHGEALDELWEQGMDTLSGAVSGVPSSAADIIDCALEYCGSRFAGAVGAVSTLLGASESFSGGIDARVWWGRWRDRLNDLKVDLQEAQRELDECLERRARQAKELDDAMEHNRRGQPKYPADHPLCNPPQEDESSEEIGDATGGGAVSGGSSGAAPDWSQIDSYTRDQTRDALDWMDRELEGCASLGSAARACVNRTLNKRTVLQGHIDRSGARSASSAEQSDWQQMRERIRALRVRGNEIKSGG